MEDDIAAIRGSMLLSPLMSAFVASAIGLALIDVGEELSGLDLFYSGIKNGIIGIAMVIGLSWVTAALAKAFVPLQMTDQLAARSSPNLADLVIALGAGLAGSVAMLHEKGESALVGSAIAIALIPPASAVGVGLAMGSPSVTIGSFSLLTVNVISLITAGYLSARLYALIPIVRLASSEPILPEGEGAIERAAKFLGEVLTRALFIAMAWLKVALLGIYSKTTGFKDALKSVLDRIYHVATPILLSVLLGALISTNASVLFSAPLSFALRTFSLLTDSLRIRALLEPYWNEVTFLVLMMLVVISLRYIYSEVSKAREGDRRSLIRVVSWSILLWLACGYLLGAHKFSRVAAVLSIIMISTLTVTINKRLWENRKRVALLAFIVIVLLTLTIHSALAFERARLYETTRSRGLTDLIRGIVASYAGLKADEVRINVTVEGGKWVVWAEVMVPENKFRTGPVMTGEVVKAAEVTLKQALGEDVILRVRYVIIPG